MNKQRIQKYQTSKLYKGPHDLSIAFNNDSQHQKLWAEKVQQAKHVQQKKQIDKILQKIVMEKMFGNFLAEDTRISTKGYYALDTISRQQVNPSRFRHSRRFSRAQTINMRNNNITSRQQNVISSRQYSRTLQPISLRQISRTLQSKNSNRKPSIQLSKRLPLKIEQSYNLSNSIQSPSKKLKAKEIKQLNLAKIPDFSQFFRKIVGNVSTMIYDLKVTKQQILLRGNGLVASTLFEKLYFFFNIPTTMNYRQYCNVVQNLINCPLKDVYFFLFRVLDSNKTGVLTISDLFKALQLYPDNQYVQSQIYLILNYLKQFKQQRRGSSKANRRKNTVQQVLVTNHSLKLQDVRQLVKAQNHDLSSINCIRSTCYHNSILSIDHDVNYRLKQSQIQDNRQSHQGKKKKGINMRNFQHNQNKQQYQTYEITQEGIRLLDFIKFFQNKRPKMFTQFAQIFAGVNPQQYQ